LLLLGGDKEDNWKRWYRDNKRTARGWRFSGGDRNWSARALCSKPGHQLAEARKQLGLTQ
jgi:hypothetical protein